MNGFEANDLKNGPKVKFSAANGDTIGRDRVMQVALQKVLAAWLCRNEHEGFGSGTGSIGPSALLVLLVEGRSLRFSVGRCHEGFPGPRPGLDNGG